MKWPEFVCFKEASWGNVFQPPANCQVARSVASDGLAVSHKVLMGAGASSSLLVGFSWAEPEVFSKDTNHEASYCLARYNRPQMPGTWRKIVAGFILIWALLDMSVPGVCQSDDLESSPVSALEIQPAAPTPFIIQAYSSIPDDSSPNHSGPEDCFCCCSHVTPTTTFIVPQPVFRERYSTPDLTLSPLEYSPILYHPPQA